MMTTRMTAPTLTRTIVVSPASESKIPVYSTFALASTSMVAADVDEFAPAEEELFVLPFPSSVTTESVQLQKGW